MRDLPVIMSGPMVLATLREIEKPGTGKTNTRRLAWGDEFDWTPNCKQRGGMHVDVDRMKARKTSPWQKVKPGDRLWVRETWRASYDWDCYSEKLGRCPRPSEITPGSIVSYLADEDHGLGGKRRVAIHMPRWASRLTLIVTATKMEQLQAIREAECIAEGAKIEGYVGGPVDDGPMVRMGPAHVYGTPRTWFRELWDTLHGAGAWDANPEVVAITFRPVLANIDALPKAEAA